MFTSSALTARRNRGNRSLKGKSLHSADSPERLSLFLRGSPFLTAGKRNRPSIVASLLLALCVAWVALFSFIISTDLPGDAPGDSNIRRRLSEAVSSGGEQHEADEFPYPLSCPRWLHKESGPLLTTENKFNVVLAYHIGLIGENWETIVKDQLQTISKCGLGDIITRSIISYAGESDRVKSLTDLLRQYSFVHDNAIIVEATDVPWESDAMNAVHNFCSAAAFDDIPTVVFYIQNKGSSKDKTEFSTISRSHVDWREAIGEGIEFTYGHSLYWRKYMEYFTIERPELCIDKIVNEGYPACGVNLQDSDIAGNNKNHFSGNFWTASCDYIRTLKPIYRDKIRERIHKDKTPDSLDDFYFYISAETWIGTGWGEDDEPYSFDQQENSNCGSFYRTLIMPEDYWVSPPAPAPPIVFGSNTNQVRPNFSTYIWDHLPDDARAAAELLGYNEDNWESNDQNYPPLLDTYLEDLSEKEFSAVSLLSLASEFSHYGRDNLIRKAETLPAIELPRFLKVKGDLCNIDPIANIAMIATEPFVAPVLSEYHEKQPAALWNGDALGGNPDRLRVSLVVSHCKENLGWLQDFIAGIAVHNITIVSKCGVALNDEDLPTDARVIRLPNVGRCDHTMAYWMARMPSKPHDNDIVVFLKDSLDVQRKDAPMRTLRDTLRIATVNRFGCFRYPSPDLSSLHVTEALEEFYITQYNGDGPVKNSNNGFGTKYDRMGNWLKDLNLTLPKPLTPVCYGGMFAVQSKRISSLPRETFLALEESLSRDDNIAEGHYAERTWAGLFSKPLRPNQPTQIVSKQAEFVYFGRFGMFGALASGSSVCTSSWSTYNWADMSDSAKESATLLGFDEKVWDNDLPVSVYSTPFQNLDPKKKSAVIFLGLESFFGVESTAFHEARMKRLVSRINLRGSAR